MTVLPQARGALSQTLLERLRQTPHRLPDLTPDLDDPLCEDAQLALYVLQEVAYRPVIGVDEAWEDEPSAVALRVRLERGVEELLRSAVAVPACEPADVPDALAELVANAEGPSLSGWVQANGTLDHVREFAVHRAAYQLKEADQHATAIPRLPAGAAKAGLLDIEVDEFGCEPSEAHAALFADTMTELGLDPGRGPDLDRLPAATLATNTLLGTLAGSRRLVGAILGHLAVFEMTSVDPMARYAATIRRLLPGPAANRAARFYDVHVAADARHEVVALDRMIRPFVAADPGHAHDVLFGAAALLLVERCFAEHVLDCWVAGRSSLRSPLPGSALGVPASPLSLAG